MTAPDLRLIIATDKQNAPTWIPLLGALDAEGLLDRLRLRRVPRAEVLAEFEDARRQGERAALALTLRTVDMEWAGPLLTDLRERRAPGDWIIAGGAHPSARPEDVLRAGADLAVVGEGEVAFAEFVRRLTEGDDPRPTPGACFLRDGRLIRNEPPPLINLDQSRSSVPSLKLLGPVELTRGCRWGCRYCQTPRLWAGIERHRSIDSAVTECEPFGFFVQFMTPNAFGYRADGPGQPNTPALVRMLETIQSRQPHLRLNLGNFPSEARPDYITRDVLKAVRPLLANRVIAIGAQSGSPRVLKAIGRGHTPDDVFRSVEQVIACDFVPYVDVIFGLPGETETEAAMTREMVRRLHSMNARLRGHIFMPLPGSPFEDVRPARVSPETRELLRQLEETGAADGDWREQM